jgi:hypothetical protein
MGEIVAIEVTRREIDDGNGGYDRDKVRGGRQALPQARLNAPDIVRLRTLHSEMDACVLRAYG